MEKRHTDLRGLTRQAAGIVLSRELLRSAQRVEEGLQVEEGRRRADLERCRRPSHHEEAPRRAWQQRPGQV